MLYRKVKMNSRIYYLINLNYFTCAYIHNYTYHIYIYIYAYVCNMYNGENRVRAQKPTFFFLINKQGVIIYVILPLCNFCDDQIRLMTSMLVNIWQLTLQKMKRKIPWLRVFASFYDANAHTQFQVGSMMSQTQNQKWCYIDNKPVYYLQDTDKTDINE